MSDIDLSAAIEQARYAIETDPRTATWRFVGEDQHDTFLAREIAQVATSAASPLIEAVVRDQIMVEVERRVEAFIRHGEAVPADVTTYDRSAVHNDLRILVGDLRSDVRGEA